MFEVEALHTRVCVFIAPRTPEEILILNVQRQSRRIASRTRLYFEGWPDNN